jgi:hypothetical protein
LTRRLSLVVDFFIYAAELAMLELPSGDANDADVPRLDASGGTIAMDHLGPIVVNVDGTLARITNWEVLSQHEQDVARRRVAKRNAERLAVLKAAANET